MSLHLCYKSVYYPNAFRTEHIEVEAIDFFEFSKAAVEVAMDTPGRAQYVKAYDRDLFVWDYCKRTNICKQSIHLLLFILDFQTESRKDLLIKMGFLDIADFVLPSIEASPVPVALYRIFDFRPDKMLVNSIYLERVAQVV